MYEFGPFRLDPQKRTLVRDGQPIPLTPKVFETLLILVENSERVVSKDDLMKSLWPESFVEESNLSQNIFVLRKALGDSTQERKYILTAPGKGYGFAEKVRKVETEPAPVQTETTVDELVVESRSRSRIVVEKSRSSSRAIPVALALVVVSGGMLLYRYVKGARARSPDPKSGVVSTLMPRVRRSVAVIGFKNLSGRPQQAWLSTALSEMLTTELAAGEMLRTIPGENVARVKFELALPESDAYAPDTLARLNQNLGADFVVSGSFFDLGKESGGAVRLDLRIQDALSGETVATISKTGTEVDLPGLVSQAGIDLRQRLGADPLFRVQTASLTAAQTTNREAARYYAEGLVKLRAFDYRGARDLLLKSIAAEANFVPAHIALADAYTEMNEAGHAREEAEKAYDLSSPLSREYRLLAEAHYRRATGDLDKAIAAYGTLFKLFPDNVDYGLRLAATQTIAVKGHDAISTLDQIRKLPPVLANDPRVDLTEAHAAHSIGDYPRSEAAAARSAKRAKELGATLLYANARHDQCWALGRLGQIDDALALCEESKKIFEDAHDENSVANLLNSSAAYLQDQGKLPLAKARYEEALSVYRTMDDLGGVDIVLNNLAIVNRRLGNRPAAEAMYREAIALSRRIGDKDTEILAMGNLGAMLESQGELRPALAILEELLGTCRKIGSKDRIALQLHNIGEIRFFQGDLNGSQKALEEAVSLDREAGDRRQLGYSLAMLGAVFEARADFAGARKALGEALEIRTELGEKGELADSRVGLAELALEEGHASEAVAEIRSAVADLGALGLPDDTGSAYVALIRGLLASGKADEAAQAVKEAAAIVSKSEDRMVHFGFAIAGAMVQAARGNKSQARAGLARIVGEARKEGFLGQEFEARLALGEIEISDGSNSANGRTRLAAVEKEAAAKGFLLAARKARANLTPR